jgi:hypothetical protein
VCEVITDLNFTVPTHLPAPEVPEADGEILDLRNFNGDATVIIRKWAFMEAGQKGWLECLGTLKDGTAYTLQLMDGEPITANEVENGISRVLLREELEKLLHDSPLTIVFKTAVDACCEEGPVVVFPELKLALKKQLLEIRELFEDQTLGTFSAGGVVDTPTMTITFESGTGTAGIVRYYNNEFASGNHYGMTLGIGDLTPPQIHRFDFKYALVYLTFSWTAKQKFGAVNYYDENNDLLERTEIPGDQFAGFWVEYVPPFGKTVGSMVMEIHDYSFVDFFTMRYQS